MSRYLPLMAALLCLVPMNANAAEKAFDGQGFDCFFQTGKQKLERVTIWHGGLKYKNDKAPQVTDPAKLFVLGGLTEGKAIRYYVTDKWPANFEIQYYQLDKGTTPSSLLSITGGDEGVESFPAEIIHLPSDMKPGVTVQPIKRVTGRCSTNPAITFVDFKATSQ